MKDLKDFMVDLVRALPELFYLLAVALILTSPAWIPGLMILFGMSWQ